MTARHGGGGGVHGGAGGIVGILSEFYNETHNFYIVLWWDIQISLPMKSADLHGNVKWKWIDVNVYMMWGESLSEFDRLKSCHLSL